jgi:hypothetical protein
MRGSPLLQCLVGAIAFALFAIPLTRLTLARMDAHPMEPASQTTAESAGKRHTFIRVRLAHPPESLSLKLNGREIIPSPTPPIPSLIETEASLPLSKDGIELMLAARWPEGTPDTAVTVELEPDELDARRETRWSAGPALNEILSFKW